MTGGPPIWPDRVPTLTEVVSWPESGATPLPEGALPPAADAPPAEYADPDAPLAMPGAMLTEEQLAQRVLVDLQRQIDLMLDYRLREVLTPLLTRAADAIVREARTELASTLREAVSRAVAQELARHRGR